MTTAMPAAFLGHNASNPANMLADICAAFGEEEQTYLIVRPDLGLYMRNADLHRLPTEDRKVYQMHPACVGGTHYVFADDGWFYIIEGSEYRRTRSLRDDTEGTTRALGDWWKAQAGAGHTHGHFVCAGTQFYYIDPNQGTYRSASRLYSDNATSTAPVCNQLQGGLYYWARSNRWYTLKYEPTWGPYLCWANIKTGGGYTASSLHPQVTSFLPGGPAAVLGLGFRHVKRLEGIRNLPSPSSGAPNLTWKGRVTATVGCDTEQTEQIASHWDLSEAGIDVGELAALVAQATLANGVVHGGIGEDPPFGPPSRSQDWGPQRSTEEEFTLELEPGQEAEVLQEQIGLGHTTLLRKRLYLMTNS